MNGGGDEERRDQLWQRLQSDEKWDAVIVGGGIVGAAILREAVRFGLKVLLLEQRDFAWGTSSRSSKMVHGGLRYVASGHFKIARDSVRERQRLLKQVPGLVEPLKYLFADRKGKFPGRRSFTALLMIYDLFARRMDHRFLNRNQLAFQAPQWQQDGLKGACQYTDAATDDARLVLRVLQEAVAAGGQVMNYCSVQSLLQEDNGHEAKQAVGVVARNILNDETASISAGVVINATGVWTDQLRQLLAAESTVRPLRGSHLVFPAWKLPVLQSVTLMHPEDKRPVFIFPWEGSTIVGTTDLDHEQDLSVEPSISRQEVDYLFAVLDSEFPSVGLKESDVISTYAGVRSVIGTGRLNPSSEKREHCIWNDNGLVSVAGGKLTTFRLIAQDVLEAASTYLPALKDVKSDAPVFDSVNGSTSLRLLLGADQCRRLIGRYGREIVPWIESAEQGELELIPGTHTLWTELKWAAARERVVHLDDLLLRRTRIGLLVKQGASEHLPRIKELCQSLLDWDDSRWQEEVERYNKLWQSYYSLPVAAEGASL